MNFNNRVFAPCLGCENRHPNCHPVCELYIKFKQDLAASNERIRKDKTPEVRDYKRDQIRRAQIMKERGRR